MNTDEYLVLSLGLVLVVLAVHEYWAPQFAALFTPPGTVDMPAPAKGLPHGLIGVPGVPTGSDPVTVGPAPKGLTGMPGVSP